jgi:formylglycine-generating enzyme required for sulfatase activity/V8-like Glu-specific endopeptidase
MLARWPSGAEGVYYCTATLLGPDTILTNAHCIPGEAGDVAAGMKVKQARIVLGYLQLGDPGAKSYSVKIEPIEHDHTLDYSLLRVEGDPASAFPVTQRPIRAALDNERLFLIHHPGGQPQKLTQAFCRAHPEKPVEGTDVRHQCDTLGGSSGSLLMAQSDGAIVGLHYSGGLTPNDALSYNSGTDVLALVKGGREVGARLVARTEPAAADAPSFKLAEDERKRMAEEAAGKAEAEARRKAEQAAAEAAEAKRKEEQRVAMLAEEEKKKAEAKAAEEAAKAAGPKIGETFRDCPECPEMVVVPAGSFTMGSPESEEGHQSDEGPQRTVTIAKAFAVGKFEVTRDQFEAFVKDSGFRVADECFVWTGTEFKEQSGSFRKPGFDQAGTHPVVCVIWDDAKAYAEWLSKKTGKSYRLLTEAEWEYATRGVTEAGPQPRYHFGNDAKALCGYANGGDLTAKTKFKDWTVADCKDGHVFTAPAGSFKPNAFGLHDMHGNVWEWVEDCYKDSYKGAPTDGSAVKETSGCLRVLRGGSWGFRPDFLRAANRDWIQPGNRDNGLGLRVGRTLIP